MPAPTRDHVGQHRGHAVDDADDVDRDYVARLARFELSAEGRRAHPGVGDQNIRPAPRLAHAPGHALHLLRVSHVRRQRQRPPAPPPPPPRAPHPPPRPPPPPAPPP